MVQWIRVQVLSPSPDVMIVATAASAISDAVLLFSAFQQRFAEVLLVILSGLAHTQEGKPIAILLLVSIISKVNKTGKDAHQATYTFCGRENEPTSSEVFTEERTPARTSGRVVRSFQLRLKV